MGACIDIHHPRIHSCPHTYTGYTLPSESNSFFKKKDHPNPTLAGCFVLTSSAPLLSSCICSLLAVKRKRQGERPACGAASGISSFTPCPKQITTVTTHTGLYSECLNDLRERITRAQCLLSGGGCGFRRRYSDATTHARVLKPQPAAAGGRPHLWMQATGRSSGLRSLSSS